MSWSERLSELALDVMGDPTSTPEDRAQARAAVVDEPLDVARLSREERAELGRLLRRARDPSVEPVMLPSPRIPEPRVLSVEDHIAAIIAIDPDGEDLRAYLATIVKA